jgi:hypothetical protein
LLKTAVIAGQLIIKLYGVPFPVQLFPSVAVTVIVKVPVWIGVPLNIPVVDKIKPAGRELEVVYVTVDVPPVEVNVWLKAVPAVPVVVRGLVTVITGQALISRL